MFRNRELSLQIKLEELEKRLPANKDDQPLHAEVMRVKQELKLITIGKAKGAQIRSRIKWIEEGERNTALFLNLGGKKRNFKNKIMSRIVNDDGEAITNENGILTGLATFYTNLYNQKTEREGGTRMAVDTFLEGIEFPKLEEEEADRCEGLVTKEVGQALNSMKNGSAPGGDGLTVLIFFFFFFFSFFFFFGPKLKIMATNAFNEAFASELTYTQRQKIIILLHKGKDLPRDRLNNWRPITLSNTDYKILAKVTARRMGLVVNKLINEDQVGYLKGRNISNILRNIDHVIDY